ncbi:MAG: helix-turn-helix transcriptional regulator [Eubacterium sp.]|nr:helix-turn-helix transcriptional regulator [Eubacterium sp.]
MKQFGDRLRDLREGRDLKQRDVANDLFISNKVLSSYERNIAFPSLDMFKKICEYYNVSADYLLQTDIKKAEDEPAADTSRLVALTPGQARLLSYYERLDRENQDAVRGLMVLYYKEQLRKQAKAKDDSRVCGSGEFS